MKKDKLFLVGAEDGDSLGFDIFADTLDFTKAVNIAREWLREEPKNAFYVIKEVPFEECYSYEDEINWYVTFTQILAEKPEGK